MCTHSTIPNADKNTEKLSYSAPRNKYGTVTMKNNMVISYKIKCILPSWSCNHFPGHLAYIKEGYVSAEICT